MQLFQGYIRFTAGLYKQMAEAHANMLHSGIDEVLTADVQSNVCEKVSILHWAWSANLTCYVIFPLDLKHNHHLSKRI